MIYQAIHSNTIQEGPQVMAIPAPGQFFFWSSVDILSLTCGTAGKYGRFGGRNLKFVIYE